MIKQLFVTDNSRPLTEKEFSIQLSVYIVLIVLCLVAMSYCAIALFWHTQNENFVSVAQMFEIDVSAQSGCDMVSKNTFRASNDGDTPLDCEFVIKPKQDLLGYCRVLVANGTDIKKFYTGSVSGEQKIVVTVPARTALTVKFAGQLGSCALPQIKDKITLN